MSTTGKINDLGRQYIGAVPPNTTGDYIPGVVSGGKGGQPQHGGNDTSGDPSPAASALSYVFSVLAAALFAALLL